MGSLVWVVVTTAGCRVGAEFLEVVDELDLVR
jgi:hypothetical protein